MPKQRRKQQHLKQQQARNKSYALGGPASQERYKPGFPMNIIGNVKIFSVVGVGVAAIMVLAAIISGQNTSQTSAERPTPTPGTPTATPDPNATPTPSPTPDAKQFAQADQVIDAQTKKYTATIKTDKGDIVMDLLADKAPNTVNTFVFLAQKGYFDGITFHRVEPNFVVQGGDPTGTGRGGPGFQTEEDKNDLQNKKGFVSMAKAGAVTQFGSQFFINLKDNPALDSDTPQQKRFYPWAQVRPESMAVVERIAQGDVMRSVTIVEEAK